MSEIKIRDPKTGAILGRIKENGETEITEEWKTKKKAAKVNEAEEAKPEEQAVEEQDDRK